MAVTIKGFASDWSVPEPAKAALASTFATLDALSRQPVRKDEVMVNAKDHGATGDGTTDDTAALNTAAQAALTAKLRLFIPGGTYKTTGTVVFPWDLDATQATISYTGTGDAVVLGSTTAGSITARREFWCPRVVKAGRVTGWDGTSRGIVANNLNTCQLYVPFVQDFENGLVLNGNSGGNAYNNVFLGALWENHKNLILTCTPDGYTNQNQFWGGRLQMSTSKGATIDDPNANQISMVAENPEGGPNNNTFVGTSLEGARISYYSVDIAGRYNEFINCRWEYSNGQPHRVYYRAGARWNSILRGYASQDIIEVFEAGSLGGGEIRDADGAFTKVNATAGQLIPHSVWTTVNSWGTPVGRRITLNASTGEFTPRPGRWLIGATVTFATNATGRRIARINCAGTVVELTEAPGNAVRTSLKMQTVNKFTPGQTFKIEVNQTSGADLALETSPPYVQVWAEYLGY